MSRGPGTWQRAILDSLEEHDVATVRDVASTVLGRPPTQSESTAVRRATYRLLKDGKVGALYLGLCSGCRKLSMRFQCRICRTRTARVLVAVRPDWPRYRLFLESPDSFPAWVGVAVTPPKTRASPTGAVGG